MDIKQESYVSPWEVLQRYPNELPVVFLGGSKGYAILATSFSEAQVNDILEQTFDQPNTSNPFHLPFTEGYLGVLPYWDFSNKIPPQHLLKIYRVYSCLVFDLDTKRMFRCEGTTEGTSCHLDITHLLQSKPRPVPLNTQSITLKEVSDKNTYISMINQAIKQIKSGRYYQINLLKYFEVRGTTTRSSLLHRLEKKGGPYTAFFDFPDFKLASFSPEQFITVKWHKECYLVKTCPIKGTMPRSSDSLKDRLYYKKLQESKKDHAELHIIVDLMRNDLHRISQKGSVKVLSPGSIHSFATVHHLIAEIQGSLKPSISLRDILYATSPGGSITGAPKKEVMQAIEEFESRSRDYFMGHCFYWDYKAGRFDSSILIRTLVAKGGKHFEYAAGSGITISSDPDAELLEISDKCKVLTEPL